MTLTIDMPDSVARLLPGASIDFERMRRHRHGRARQAMAEADLDVLMLGGNGNIHYISGARRLWHAGAMAWSPSGLLVRDSGEIFLVSMTTDGIPDDIPIGNLCPPSWNPQNMLRFLAAIPAVRDARRVGVDGMSPFFAKLLPQLAPKAAFVSAEPALRRARAVKSEDEIQCLRIATRIAAEAVASAASSVRPGVTPRALQAVAMERMTGFGATIPGHAGLFAILPRDPATALVRLISDAPAQAGDHVGLAASVMFAGYEGNAGRTALCGNDARGALALAQLRDRWAEQWQELAALLKPGVPFAEIGMHLSACAEGASFIAIDGVGIGMEPPRLHSARPAAIGPDAVLQAGMTLAVETCLCSREQGSLYWGDTVVVTGGGAELLSGTLARTTP